MLAKLLTISGARLAVIALQLVNIKLYVSYLNPEQLGVYFFLLTLSYAANAILFVPFDYFQQANLTKTIEVTGGVRPLLLLNARLTKAYMLFAMLLCVVCYVIEADYFYYSVCAVLMAWALYAVQGLRNMLNNCGYSHVVSVSVVLEALLRVILFFAFAEYFQASALTLMLAWIISLGIAALHLAVKSFRLGLFNSKGLIQFQMKKVFEFSYPISVLAVCNWLQLQGYRLALVPLGYVEAVGIFATLSGIGGASVGAVNQIYSQQFTPGLYKTSGRSLHRYLAGAMALLIAVGLLLLIFGAYVDEVLSNVQIGAHWHLMLFGVFTDGSNVLTSALVVYATLTANSKVIFRASIIGLGTTLLGFVALLVTQTLNMNTIGIPLLLSQWIALFYMYVKRESATLNRVDRPNQQKA